MARKLDLSKAEEYTVDTGTKMRRFIKENPTTTMLVGKSKYHFQNNLIFDGGGNQVTYDDLPDEVIYQMMNMTVENIKRHNIDVKVVAGIVKGRQKASEENNKKK